MLLPLSVVTHTLFSSNPLLQSTGQVSGSVVLWQKLVGGILTPVSIPCQSNGKSGHVVIFVLDHMSVVSENTQLLK